MALKIKLLLEGPDLHPRDTITREFTLESMVESTLAIYRRLTQ